VAGTLYAGEVKVIASSEQKLAKGAKIRKSQELFAAFASFVLSKMPH